MRHQRKCRRISQKALYETWDLFHAEIEIGLGYLIGMFIPGPGLPREIYRKDNFTPTTIIKGNNGELNHWIVNKITEIRRKG